MSNRINFLPPWVETNLQPAFYDLESGTSLQQTARMYAKVNQLIRSVNEQNETIADYIQKFVDLKDYVDDYFDNLDVQNEINNKLDEMTESGELQSVISNLVDGKIEVVEDEIANIQAQISSITNYPPVYVSSVDAMTDHTKVYVLTTNSKWYYYNGTAFVAGGDYLTSGSLYDIEYYTKTTNSADTINIFNPYTCSNESAMSTQTGVVSTNSNFWITDYIPVDTTKVMEDYSNGHLYGVISLPFSSPFSDFGIYKQVYFDANNNFLFANATASRFVFCPTANLEQEPSIAYVRLQFAKSTVPFESRDTLQLQLLGKNYTVRDYYTSHYAVNSNNIGSGGIKINSFSDNLKNTIIETALDKGFNPFDVLLFSNVTIASADGTISYTSSSSPYRLSTVKVMRVPSGTEISLAEGWEMLALEYNSADEYIGRYASDWSNSIYFPESAYIRLTFRTNPYTEITSQASVENLVASISVNHRTGGTSNFFYNGEKITLHNEFTATGTGLRTYHQDGAIYDNTIIELGSEGTYFVQDINGNILQSNTPLDQSDTIIPHANSVCFGTEKYQNSDHYPVFYANAYNNTSLPKGACYVYRLKNDYLTTLLQTIRIGFTEDNIWTGGGINIRPYGNFVVDTDNNKLYVYTLIDNLNVTRFFKFNLPTLSEGSSVILNTGDIEEYFDVPYMPYIQGVCYFNGKIYVTAGNNSIIAGSSKLNVVDLTKKETVSTVYLGNQFSEPETIFVKDNTLYIGQTRLYAYQF